MIEIREHIKTVFEALGIKLKEYKKDNSLHSSSGRSDYFDTYTVDCDDFPQETNDNCITESPSPTLTLYKGNQKRGIKIKGESITLARDISSGLIHPRYFKDGISRVSNAGFTIGELEGNSDVTAIIINLNYELTFPLKG